MTIVELPVKVERELYGSAAHDYAAKVRRGALAVYQTGNISYPGLSDLDLLVVPARNAADNAQYFSAVHRLPAIYRSILHHDPFVMPLEHKNVLRYTTHRNLHLLAGTDALGEIHFVDSAAEHWCKLLEAWCSYASFVAYVETTDRVRGRRLVPKASSFRFSLRLMDELRASAFAGEYARTVDSMREAFFSSDPLETLERMWALFHDAYNTVRAWLTSVLPLREGEAIDDFARRMFSGDATFEAVPTAYVLRRSAEIDAFHEALVRLRIPYGQIFFWEAHGERSRMHRQPALENMLYRMKYKIERALTQAHGV